MFRKWIVAGSLPGAVWISAFYQPQSFLTALLLQESRNQQIAVEKLRLDINVHYSSEQWDWKSKPAEVPLSLSSTPSGCLIYGLYAQCAQWSATSQGLVDAAAADLALVPMPVLQVNVIQRPPLTSTLSVKQPSKEPSSPSSKLVEFPVYRTSARARNVFESSKPASSYQQPLVMRIFLPSQLSATHWLKRGAALLTQTNE
jgi:dynein heavy chain